MISTARRLGSVIAVAALVVVGCAGEGAGEVQCDRVAEDLIVATQDFLDVLDDRVWEEVPFISTAEWWISEYADTHMKRTRLFVSLGDSLGDAEIDTLATEVEQMDGVLSVRVVNQEEALAEMSVLFADQPEILEQILTDPGAVPASLRVGITPESASEIIAEFETRTQVVEVIEDPVSIDDLAHGVSVLDLPEPAFDEPMERAASQGCTTDVLLAEMRARSDELLAYGSAGDAFIASIKDR